MRDTRQEFELAIGEGLALSDLSEECVRMIRNALPFAGEPHAAYLAATWKADPLPRDTFNSTGVPQQGPQQDALTEQDWLTLDRIEQTLTTVGFITTDDAHLLIEQVTKLGKAVHRLSASRIDPPVPSPGGDTEAPIVIPGSIQKALTVVMVPDCGAQQADAALAAMKNGTQTIVMAASEMFFHQLRLRVAENDALADKIAVFYARGGELEPVGLRFKDELRWPAGFLQSAWEKETDIQAHRATRDEVCKHGTAMDVHCCNCHSGFIFDNNHECPERAND